MGSLLLKKLIFEGFPDGSVVKNLPANAGDMGSVPDTGRSHTEQLSPCSSTAEPVSRSLETGTTAAACPEPGSATGGPSPARRAVPLAPTRPSLQAGAETEDSQTKERKKFFLK